MPEGLRQGALDLGFARVKREFASTCDGEGDEAARERDVFEQVCHLVLIAWIKVIEQARGEAEGSQRERCVAGEKACHEQEARNDFKQDGRPCKERRQAARSQVACEAFDVAELAKPRHEEKKAHEDTGDEKGCVAVLGHCVSRVLMMAQG